MTRDWKAEEWFIHYYNSAREVISLDDDDVEPMMHRVLHQRVRSIATRNTVSECKSLEIRSVHTRSDH